jgi:hypothetical protein
MQHPGAPVDCKEADFEAAQGRLFPDGQHLTGNECRPRAVLYRRGAGPGSD